MKRTILEFCGIRPVRSMNFGPVKSASAKKRERWLAKAFTYGERA